MLRRIFRFIGKVCLGIFFALLAIYVILEIALSPAILSKVVDKYAEELIDGDISYENARISMFKRFPSIGLTLDNFSITYPADRFDSIEKAGSQGWLTRQGQGEEVDTLASFDRFSASIRPLSLLMGTIKIPHMNLVRPRIFAHSYKDGSANWNMFKIQTSEEDTDQEDEQTSDFPRLSLGEIALTEHPHIIYTDSRDTLFLLLNVKEIKMKGKVNRGKGTPKNIGLGVDSLIAAGRMGRDTLAFGLKNLNIVEKGRKISLHTEASTFLATRAFGRMRIPIVVDGDIKFLRGTIPYIDIENINADICYIPINAKGRIKLKKEALAIEEAELNIDDCHLENLLREIVVNIIPETEKISTDAVLRATVKCNGEYDYNTGALPDITAGIYIPESEIRHKDFGDSLTLRLGVETATDSKGRLNVDVKNTRIGTTGLEVELLAGVKDALAADPGVNLTGNLAADFEELTSFIPDSLGITAKGSLTANLEGKAKLSELNLYNFSSADLLGLIRCTDTKISSAKDSIDVYVGTLDVKLGPENVKSRVDSTESFDLLSITAKADSLNVNMGSLKAVGKKIDIVAKSSSEIISGKDTTDIHHLGGFISADRVYLSDSEGTAISVSGTKNGFQLVPKRSNSKVPVLMFNSSNKSIALKSGFNRARVRNVEVKASAVMNSIERKQRVKAYLDSLALVYPDVPRDSLFFKAHPKRKTERKTDLPDWLTEEDFRKQDIDIRLDKTLAKYFREWDINGDISVGKGSIMTPYFPLRNNLLGFKGHFDNNQVRIDQFQIKAGKSDIGATGRLSGLKRALTSGTRSLLRFDLDVMSSNMDANELLSAYATGAKFQPEDAHTNNLEEVSDEEYMETMVVQPQDTSLGRLSLIVVPGNLNADISLDARNFKYSDLNVSKLTTNIKVKERCLQVTNTMAESNMGDIHFNGFYSSRTKKDLKAGFSFNFKDITAEKVISLMPAIDTLMPMLKSFYGLLNCEIAATSQIDTNMNLVIPSIDGIIRISGKDLFIKDNEMFRTLARKLIFKNKKEGHIEQLTVEGIISDSTVEIFPFIIKMDRYMLGLSGIQNMDMSFKYHISLIKSPFLFRLGLDLHGPDFDNMKFKLGRPKYKNANVPVFSSEIDTKKINLVNSIENIFKKGVDAAIRENHSLSLERAKKAAGYVRAVDQEMEELSEDEIKQMEADSAAAEAEENAESNNAETGENIAAEQDTNHTENTEVQ